MNIIDFCLLNIKIYYFNILLQCENIQNSEKESPLTSSVLINNIKTSLSSQSKIDACHLDELIDYLEHMKQTSKAQSSKEVDLSDSFLTSSPLNKYSTRRSLNKQFESSLDTEFVDSTLMEVSNGSVEQLKQMYNQCKLENQKLSEKCEKIEKDWECRYNQLCKVADNALDEAKRLKDECTNLENGIDALRNEYFECEEYWSIKLEEERKLNELVSIVNV